MPQPVAIDFRRPPYLSRWQLQTVRQAQEGFAKSLTANLSAFFRLGVEVTIESVELTSYAEFSERVGTTACAAGLWLPAESARAVLQMAPSLVFPLLELILGGGSRPREPIERELTEIERNLLEGLIRVVLREWKESWKRLMALEFLIESVQSPTSVLDLLPAGETVVAISVDFRISDNKGRMNLALPALTVKSLWPKGENQVAIAPVANPEVHANLWELLRTSAIQIEAQVAGPTIKFRDLLALTTGQVLMLEHPIENGVIGSANESRCFQGRLARKGAKRVLEIQAVTGGARKH